MHTRLVPVCNSSSIILTEKLKTLLDVFSILSSIQVSCTVLKHKLQKSAKNFALASVHLEKPYTEKFNICS